MGVTRFPVSDPREETVAETPGNITDVPREAITDCEQDFFLDVLHAVFDIVSDPIWLKDTRCRYLLCNAAFEAFSGFSEQEIIGKTDHDLFSRTIADAIVKNDMQAMLSAHPVETRRPFYTKEGQEWNDVVTVKTAVKSASRELTGVLSIRKLPRVQNREAAVAFDDTQKAATDSGSGAAAELKTAPLQLQDSGYRLEDDIRRGIEAGEFTTFFQPKICLASNRIVGAEALIRWKHPRRGHIPPSMFLPMAEATGLILPISDLVLDDACAFVSAWNTQSGHSHTVSVNLSCAPLVDTTFLNRVRALPDAHHCNPNVLEFEITEALINAHSHAIEDSLMALHTMGVGIVIDDFGSGHLGFTHLAHLPIKTLKIDRVFVKNIEDNPRAASLLRAMVAMAHELGMDAVAEGVETPVDRNRAKDAGCDVAQGYYWCRPLARDDFMAWTQAFASENSYKTP